MEMSLSCLNYIGAGRGKNLYDIESGGIFKDSMPLNKQMQAKINRWEYIKLRFCIAKEKWPGLHGEMIPRCYATLSTLDSIPNILYGPPNTRAIQQFYFCTYNATRAKSSITKRHLHSYVYCFTIHHNPYLKRT